MKKIMCVLLRANAWRAIVLPLTVVFWFVPPVLMHAVQINPPAPGTQTPGIFVGCSGCTLVASIAPQTVTSSNGNWQAILVTAVFNDPNPIAGVRSGAGLDFFYQITNVSPCTVCISVPDIITRFIAIDFSTTGSNFPGLLVDIGINIGSVPGFNSAGTAQGLVDRVPPGDRIGFSFTDSAPLSVPLTPGSTSLILEIATNATHYKAGKSASIDGGTADFNSFGPSAQ
jgi:hypothetical protein